MGEDNNLEPDNTEPERTTPEPTADDSSEEAASVPAGVGAGASSPSPKGLSPGQRLAAKKAQKALDKRDFKDELKRKDEEKRAEQAEAQRFLPAQSEPALPDEVQKVAGD